MIIERLQVHGFGALRDVEIAVNSPITLLYGPNEAGKSTLLAFIRSVLFGFTPRGTSERYSPQFGGAHGGAVVLTDKQGRRIRVERSDSASNGRGRAPAAGSVRVLSEDGTIGGERELSALLAGITPELFRSLFAFGLTELQEMGTLHSDEVSGFLYSTGLGTSGSAFRAAERKLAQELEQLYRPRGRTPRMNMALQELVEAERELAQSRGEAERYLSLQAELEKLGLFQSELEAEWYGRKREADWLQHCLRARPHWLRSRELARGLAELPELAGFPDDAVRRLEGIEAEQERLAGEYAQVELISSELSHELAAMESQMAEGGDVLRHQAELEQLLEERQGYEETRRGITRSEAEEEQLAAELERMLRQLQPDWTPEHLDRLPSMALLREQALAYREDWGRWREEEAAIAAEARRLEQELGAADGKEEAEAVQEELERLTLVRRLYYEWKEAKLEARHAEQRQRDWERLPLQASGQGGRQRRSSGAGASSAGWLYAVYLLTLLLPAGLGLALHEYVAAGVAFALLLAISAGWTALLRGESPRGAGGAPLTAAPSAEREQAHAAACEAALAAELRRLPRLAAGPAAAEAAAAREAAPSLEGLEPGLDALERQLRAREAQHAGRRSAAERLQALGAQRERHAATGEPLRQRWSAWLRELALPAAAGPDAALALLQLAEQAQQHLQRLRRQRAAREALQRAAAAFEAAVAAQLGTAAGREPGPALKAWQAAQSRQLALQQQLAEGRRRHAELQRQAALLEQQRERAGERLQELLRAAGADSAEALRRMQRQAQQRKELAGELRQDELAIVTLVGEAQVAKLDEELQRSDAESLQTATAHLETEIKDLQERIEACREQKSRTRFEIERLEAGGDHAEKLQRLEERKAELQLMMKRWGVLAMCSTLFNRTKRLYEHEKQPSVMRRASEYFALVTGGRFSRMVAPVGEQNVLAEKASGELLPTSQLSRGTAEQMYLCIRFALADEYAASGVQLPLVIDDLFVNFDDERLERGMELLEAVAGRHQLLLFTCHNHVLEAYRRRFAEPSVVCLG